MQKLYSVRLENIKFGINYEEATTVKEQIKEAYTCV